MLIDETDPIKIKILLDKINNNPQSLTRLMAIFAEETDLREFVQSDIMSTKWPLAVDPLLISDNTPEDKIMRAETILSVLLPPLDNKRFLDFGCGEGFTPLVAAETAAISVGYDIDPAGWEIIKPRENLFLTSSLDKVREQAPYDLILAFDVFDHLIGSQVESLKVLRELLKPNTGKMHVRFHPWTSRHANHAYKTFNKAFCHMFMTDEELIAQGHKVLPTFKTIEPIITYDGWLKEAGFKVISREIIKEPIEDFFKQPLYANKIKSYWKNSRFALYASGKEFPLLQTEMQFIDYIVS